MTCSMSLIWAGLFLIGLAYVLIGLTPFTFEFDRPLRVHLAFITPWNALLNWACFIPFGVLIASLPGIDRPLLTAILAAALLSMAVELLQLFIPGRYCCVSDWVLNTAGAGTGALLVMQLK